MALYLEVENNLTCCPFLTHMGGRTQQHTNFHHPSHTTASDCYYPKLQRRLILQTVDRKDRKERNQLKHK
jgi:hypothetical protein